MSDVISDYQKWKQQGDDLRLKAKQAMESRFRELLTEAARIAGEYREEGLQDRFLSPLQLLQPFATKPTPRRNRPKTRNQRRRGRRRVLLRLRHKK